MVLNGNKGKNKVTNEKNCVDKVKIMAMKLKRRLGLIKISSLNESEQLVLLKNKSF